MEVSKAGGAGEVSEVQGFESGYAEKVNINKIENKNQLFLYNLKSLQHLEIKILITFVLTI